MNDSELQGTLAGRYEIGPRLGAGGMGEVYRARDVTLHRDVAIKRLTPELAGDDDHRRRFLREARSAARVTHQGVAALHDVVEERDDLYLVMEFVEGTTLQDAIRDGAVEPEEAVRLGIDIAEALSAAHRQGVVHYDIKPGNLMLTPDGRVKILDFGLAQIAARADPDALTLSALTESGRIAGTPPYMAPEVLLGRRADHRADLFSVGVVLYQLLTARNPFMASTPTAVADRILHLEPPPVVMLNPAVPPDLQPIVRKLLAKRPDQRYATVDDLLVDLRAVHVQFTHPSLSAPDAAPAPRPRSRMLWGSVATLVVVAAALGLWSWTGGREPGPTAEPAMRPAADPRDANALLTVLPLLDDRPADDDMTLLTRGVARVLSTQLARVTHSREFQLLPTGAEPFRILSPSAVEGPAVKTVADARRQLGVNLVLTIAALQQEDRVQVSLGLVDAEAGVELDGATIAGRTDASIDLSDEVGRHALRMLRLELAPMDAGALEPGTREAAAYGYFLSAEGYLDRGEPALAAEQLEQALRVDPDYVEAHARLGETLAQRADDPPDELWIERALAECDEALRLEPGSAAGHACRGRVLVASSRHAEAIPLLRRAFEIDPARFPVVANLAEAYDDTGDFDGAEAVLLAAIEARPHYAPLHDRLGYHRIINGRTEASVPAFEEAVRLAPDNYVVFANLGVAHYFLGRWPEARRAFERALELNPDYYVAYSNAGTLAFYEGDYRGAARYFERSLEVDDGDFQVWHNLAEAYRKLPGREADSESAFRRALELGRQALDADPDDTYTRALVGYFHVSLGEENTATPYLDRAAGEAGGDHFTLAVLAGASQRLGNSDAALDYLRAAIDRGYSRAEVRADPTFASLRGTPEWQQLVGDE